MTKDVRSILRNDSKLDHINFVYYDSSTNGFEYCRYPKIETVPLDVYYGTDANDHITDTDPSIIRLENIGKKQNAYIVFLLINLQMKEMVYTLDSNSFSNFNYKDFQDFPLPDFENILAIEFYSYEWSARYTNILKGIDKIKSLGVIEELRDVAGIEDQRGIVFPEGYDDPNSPFWNTEGYYVNKEDRIPEHILDRMADKIYAWLLERLKEHGTNICCLTFLINYLLVKFPSTKYGGYNRKIKNLLVKQEDIQDDTGAAGSYSDDSFLDSGPSSNIGAPVDTVNEDSENIILPEYTNIIDTGNPEFKDPAIYPEWYESVKAEIINANPEVEGAVHALEVILYGEYLDYIGLMEEYNPGVFDSGGVFDEDRIEAEYTGQVVSGVTVPGVTPSTSISYSGATNSIASAIKGSASGASGIDGMFSNIDKGLDTILGYAEGIDSLLNNAEELLDLAMNIPGVLEQTLGNVMGMVDKIANMDIMGLMSSFPGKLFDTLMNLPFVKDLFILKDMIMMQVQGLISSISTLLLPTSLKSAIAMIKKLKNIMSQVKGIMNTALQFKTLGETLKNTPEFLKQTAMGSISGIANQGMGVIAPVMSTVNKATGLLTNIQNNQIIGGSSNKKVTIPNLPSYVNPLVR